MDKTNCREGACCCGGFHFLPPTLTTSSQEMENKNNAKRNEVPGETTTKKAQQNSKAIQIQLTWSLPNPLYLQWNTRFNFHADIKRAIQILLPNSQVTPTHTIRSVRAILDSACTSVTFNGINYQKHKVYVNKSHSRCLYETPSCK